MRDLSGSKQFFLALASLLYLSVGIEHFINTAFYLKIMTPNILWHPATVQFFGACEILAAVGLLIPATRRIAAWGLVALLATFFPVDLYMAANPAEAGADGLSETARWIRVPLHFVFIAWVLWCPKGNVRSNASGVGLE